MSDMQPIPGVVSEKASLEQFNPESGKWVPEGQETQKYQAGGAIPKDWDVQPPGNHWQCSWYTTRAALRSMGYDSRQFSFPLEQRPVDLGDILKQQANFPGLEVVGMESTLSMNLSKLDRLYIDWLKSGGTIQVSWEISNNSASSAFPDRVSDHVLTHQHLLVGIAEDPTHILRSRVTYWNPYKKTFREMSLEDLHRKVDLRGDGFPQAYMKSPNALFLRRKPQ